MVAMEEMEAMVVGTEAETEVMAGTAEALAAMEVMQAMEVMEAMGEMAAATVVEAVEADLVEVASEEAMEAATTRAHARSSWKHPAFVSIQASTLVSYLVFVPVALSRMSLIWAVVVSLLPSAASCNFPRIVPEKLATAMVFSSCFNNTDIYTGGRRDDINEIMSRCSFLSTSYAPTATVLAKDISVVANRPTLNPQNPPFQAQATAQTQLKANSGHRDVVSAGSVVGAFLLSLLLA
jgi:hypothetical protein